MTNQNEFYDSEPNLQWANASISDVPRDQLRMQLEFYQESLILKGFDKEVSWIRQVSADEIAATPHASHGSENRAAAPGHAVVETVQSGNHHRDLARTASMGSIPAGEGIRGTGEIPATHAGTDLHLPQRTCPMDLRRPGEARGPGGEAVPRPHLQRIPERASMPGQPHLPGETGENPGVLLPVPLLDDGRHPGRSTKHQNQPTTYGRRSMDKMNTPWTTWFKIDNVAGIMEIPDWQPGYHRITN